MVRRAAGGLNGRTGEKPHFWKDIRKLCIRIMLSDVESYGC